MLQLQIHCANVEVDPENLDDVRRAVTMAIDRFEHLLVRTEITLRDINGPRGGIDKQCQIRLRLHSRGDIVVRAEGIAFEQAADVACSKIRNAIAKRAQRQHRATKRA